LCNFFVKKVWTLKSRYIVSILVNKDTRVVVQGITGSEGSLHTRGMIEYGTKVAAGVTREKGGRNLTVLTYLTR